MVHYYGWQYLIFLEMYSIIVILLWVTVLNLKSDFIHNVASVFVTVFNLSRNVLHNGTSIVFFLFFF